MRVKELLSEGKWVDSFGNVFSSASRLAFAYTLSKSAIDRHFKRLRATVADMSEEEVRADLYTFLVEDIKSVELFLKDKSGRFHSSVYELCTLYKLPVQQTVSYLFSKYYNGTNRECTLANLQADSEVISQALITLFEAGGDILSVAKEEENTADTFVPVKDGLSFTEYVAKYNLSDKCLSLLKREKVRQMLIPLLHLPKGTKTKGKHYKYTDEAITYVFVFLFCSDKDTVKCCKELATKKGVSLVQLMKDTGVYDKGTKDKNVGGRRTPTSKRIDNGISLAKDIDDLYNKVEDVAPPKGMADKKHSDVGNTGEVTRQDVLTASVSDLFSEEAEVRVSDKDMGTAELQKLFTEFLKYKQEHPELHLKDSDFHAWVFDQHSVNDTVRKFIAKKFEVKGEQAQQAIDSMLDDSYLQQPEAIKADEGSACLTDLKNTLSEQSKRVDVAPPPEYTKEDVDAKESKATMGKKQKNVQPKSKGSGRTDSKTNDNTTLAPIVNSVGAPSLSALSTYGGSNTVDASVILRTILDNDMQRKVYLDNLYLFSMSLPDGKQGGGLPGALRQINKAVSNITAPNTKLGNCLCASSSTGNATTYSNLVNDNFHVKKWATITEQERGLVVSNILWFCYIMRIYFLTFMTRVPVAAELDTFVCTAGFGIHPSFKRVDEVTQRNKELEQRSKELKVPFAALANANAEGKVTVEDTPVSQVDNGMEQMPIAQVPVVPQTDSFEYAGARRVKKEDKAETTSGVSPVAEEAVVVDEPKSQVIEGEVREYDSDDVTAIAEEAVTEDVATERFVAEEAVTEDVATEVSVTAVTETDEDNSVQEQSDNVVADDTTIVASEEEVAVENNQVDFIDSVDDLEMYQPVKDSSGCVYADAFEVCRLFDISVEDYKQKRAQGMTPQAIIDCALQSFEDRTDIYGNVFDTVAAMCKRHNVSEEDYLSRLADGWSKGQALGLIAVADTSVVDHLGNKHKSVEAMCDYWNVSVPTFTAMQKKGKSIESILTNPHLKKS